MIVDEALKAWRLSSAAGAPERPQPTASVALRPGKRIGWRCR